MIGLARMVQNFAPAWFASVMGTGIFAITSKFYSCYWSFLGGIAAFLWVVNTALFFIFLIPWTLRWLYFKDFALRDLGHPITGQFFATMPIGCFVLAANFLVIGSGYLETGLAVGIAKLLWLLGAVLALVFALVTPIINFFKKVALEDLNPAWFMPPVSLIVAPIAGAQLIPFWTQSLQMPLLVLNYLFWGTGFFLFVFLAIVCFLRFLIAPPLPGSLVPTTWIYLGPIGAGTLAILNLGMVSSPYLGEYALPVIKMFSLVYWGFGFWWLLAAGTVTVINILHRNLPYALSWWAFTFPLGAYAGATFLIAFHFHCPIVRLYGFLCYLLLAFCWMTVFGKTFIRACAGELFRG